MSQQEILASDTILINGAGPVGLTFAVALLDRAALTGLPKPNVQIWDPNMIPWRETLIRLPSSIAASLPEQMQMDLWEETSSRPQRLFLPGLCSFSAAVENSRVHDPYGQDASRYTAIVQTKHFQESAIRYLQARHPDHCSFRSGRCPPEILRQGAAVIQSYGKSARKTNPIAGNAVSQERATAGIRAPSEHGLFVMFDRQVVTEGAQDANYQEFNARGNGFVAFQSHNAANAVQVYIWPEDVTNDLGCLAVPRSQDDLIAHGRSFGLRSLFDCVESLQGQENWWWEVSRRCRLQNENGEPIPQSQCCTLELQNDFTHRQQQCPSIGQKASSPAFEAWFDAVRFQISLNLYKMGIFGSHAESFLHKVRLYYARREPYRYESVCTEVEGVPVIYLGDSAGSTDFKKGLSCGRGLFCAAELAREAMEHMANQLLRSGSWSLKAALACSGQKYQQFWQSPAMVAEWREDFDATYKYLQAGKLPGLDALIQSAIANGGA